MNSKALWSIVVVSTILIFAGNRYATRDRFQSKSKCKECNCTVENMLSAPPLTAELPKEPSCSVVFNTVGPMAGRETLVVLRVPVVGKIPVSTCSHTNVIFCDIGSGATLSCANAWVDIQGAHRCDVDCIGGRLGSSCGFWKRYEREEKEPPKESGFLPAKYSQESTGDEAAKEIITDSARLRLLDGEAGIETGMLMVATGGAEVRSFCTGDTFRTVGPSVIRLPACEVDVSGPWQGAYARRLKDGSLVPVTLTLNLRKESGALRGELTTSDGTFNIVEGSQSGSNLRAERTVAGKRLEIRLSGKATKRGIVFGGSENSPDGTTYNLTGFVRRLYIADNGLPPAIVNQPYNFTLLAVSPNGETTTFRLANPTAKQPEKITWTTAADSLRGRNGERFTYLCPANGTLNRSLYRGNAYTDDSSICTAAVNSHVINQQAGGVVTIQIQPGPSPDTGRFVFVGVEPQGGERGRLPRGLIFDGQSGTFSGTPTELGSFDISVVADDGAGNVFEQPFTISVKKLAVTTRLLPDAFVGQRYVATLKAAGGKPPYQFSGSGLPVGLQLNPSTGELTGTPGTGSQGSRSFSVVVRDGQNNSDPQDVSLSVRGTTILDSYFLPDATVGVPYRKQFQAVGNASPVGWSIAPNGIGLALNAQTGELTGTPTRGGTFVIEVQAQGGNSVHSRRFGLTIKGKGTRPALSITAAPVLTTGLYTLGLLMVPAVVGFVAYRTRRRKRALRFA